METVIYLHGNKESNYDNYSSTSINSELEYIELPINFEDRDFIDSKCEQKAPFEVSDSDDSTCCTTDSESTADSAPFDENPKEDYDFI